MKLLTRTAGMALACSLLFANTSMAQVSADGMGKILPVHLYVCSYQNGQDAGDLEKVIERWTRYMDDNGTDDYAAWTLTPYHYGGDQDFDVIWMGAYADGNALGAGTDNWLATGGDLRDAFYEVVDCGIHIGLASAMYKAPPGDGTPTNGIITMMDCELNEGHRYRDVRQAEVKWAEHLNGVGSTAGIFHWFPNFGGGDQDFDYKVVNVYSSYTELGKDLERRMNGGDFGVSRDIFRDIDECDDARVYVATSRRTAQLR